MAVSISLPEPFDFIKKVGIPQYYYDILLAEVEAGKLKLNLELSGLYFNKPGDLKASCWTPLTLTSIGAVWSGKAPKTVKAAIRQLIINTIEYALEAVDPVMHEVLIAKKMEKIKEKNASLLSNLPPINKPIPPAGVDTPKADKIALEPDGNLLAYDENTNKWTSVPLSGGITSFVPTSDSSFVPISGSSQPKWGEFSEQHMKTAPLVKLRNATSMYQPVAGSSKGSRYYVIGANDDLRVAAKFDQGSVSVRVEGPTLAGYILSLKSIGFSNASEIKGYASMHMAFGANALLGRKAVGAVLLAISTINPLQTPIPDLNKLLGK